MAEKPGFPGFFSKSITGKVFFGLLIVIILTLSITAVYILGITYVSGQFMELKDTSVPLISSITETEALSKEAQSNAVLYIYAGLDKGAVETSILNLENKALEHFSYIGRATLAEKEVAGELTENIKLMGNKIEEIVELKEAGASQAELGDKYLLEVMPLSSKIDQRILYLKDAYSEGMSKAGISIAMSLGAVLAWLFFSTLLIIAGFIFFARAVSNLFAKPIQDLTNATREMQTGNFSQRVDIKTGDELEELGNALNTAIAVLADTDRERKQLDVAKTEFLSITSHELRSPMTPMKAQLQMLREGYFGRLSEKQKESLNIVLRNADRLDKIIADFLEISRIEAARLKFSFKRMNPEKTIIETAEYMENYMPEKKITISTRVGRLPEIEVDPDRISQVLRNLINNAIKFSKDGGRIDVAAETMKDHILVRVRDYGVGIPEKSQVRIFEPFYQAEETMYRKYGGTGLGLAICKGIVESQNGKIWFESEQGKGTTFYFTIPFVPVRAPKPIKVLFSPKRGIEAAVLQEFRNHLGPIGEGEFEAMNRGGELTREKVIEYIENLVTRGILSKEKGEEFKGALDRVFGGERKEKVEESVIEFFEEVDKGEKA